MVTRSFRQQFEKLKPTDYQDTDGGELCAEITQVLTKLLAPGLSVQLSLGLESSGNQAFIAKTIKTTLDHASGQVVTSFHDQYSVFQEENPKACENPDVVAAKLSTALEPGLGPILGLGDNNDINRWFIERIIQASMDGDL